MFISFSNESKNTKLNSFDAIRLRNFFDFLVTSKCMKPILLALMTIKAFDSPLEKNFFFLQFSVNLRQKLLKNEIIIRRLSSSKNLLI